MESPAMMVESMLVPLGDARTSESDVMRHHQVSPPCQQNDSLQANASPPRKRQKTHDLVPIQQIESEEQRQNSLSHTKARKRRRVQIREAHTFHPPTQHPVFEEKPNLWYSQDDFTSTLMTMKKAIRDTREGSEDCSLPIYGETLASTYLACCADSESSSSSGIPSSISPAHLELLGIGRGDNRGMETCALPHLAAERSHKRREIIQSVVYVGKTLGDAMQREDCIRSVSEKLTASSRKFAQAMGISDTLSALVAYADEGGHVLHQI